MHITRECDKMTTFKQIGVGEAFMDENEPCIKVPPCHPDTWMDETKANAIYLDTGQYTHFLEEEKVYIVNMSVVIG